MNLRKISKSGMHIVAVLWLLGSGTAYADDTQYVIVCDCDPDNESDAAFEISSQVSGHAPEFGSHDGFENGDEVVIHNSSGSSSRWKINIPPGSWRINESAGFACDTNFDTCVDLTGTSIGPPFEEHDPNHGPPQPASPPTGASVAFLSCSGSTATYTVTWGGETVFQSDYFEAERRIGSTYYPWYEGDSGCRPYSSSASGVTVRIRTVSVGGNSAWVFAGDANNCGALPD